MTAVTARIPPAGAEAGLDIAAASALDARAVLDQLGTAQTGLSAAVAADRLSRYGPNAIVSHRARLLPVLWHQLRRRCSACSWSRPWPPTSSASAATR